MQARSNVESVVVEGRIVRADGTVEEQGVMAAAYRNPIKQLAWRLGCWLRGRRPGRVKFQRKEQ